jgi:hypothetical protein
MVVSPIRRARVARFTLACTGLLVIDFIVGFVSFAHCANAGDACTTANEWIDTVTITLAGLFIVLMIGGSLAAGIGALRSVRRRPRAP